MSVRPPGAVALQFVEPERKSAVFERCKEYERQLVAVPVRDLNPLKHGGESVAFPTQTGT